MENNKEVTYYRFLSEVKSFLAKLLHDPIKAEPSKYMKDLGFTRSRIINLLIKKDLLERNEKILTPDKTGGKKVKYAVIFKVKKKNFDRTMRRVYAKYFEKNLPDKNEVNECEGAGATSCSSVGAGTTNNYVGFSQPISSDVINKPLLQKIKKDRDYTDPTKILGKELNEKTNKNMGKRIYLTEEQFKRILQEEASAAGATSTSSVGAETTRGDMGYDVPAFGKSKNTRKNKNEKGTDGSFFKDAMDRKPGFSCETLK